MDKNFCTKCENMTTIHTSKENTLVHFCKACGETSALVEKNSCIYEAVYKDYDNCEKLNNNKYLANDITLPTIHNKNILCPNDSCEKKEKLRFIKYDYDNIKYIYICGDCGQKWTN